MSPVNGLVSEVTPSAHLGAMTQNPVAVPARPDGLTEGEAALVEAGVLDLDTLRAQKALEARYGVSGAKFTDTQRERIDALHAEWMALDRLYFDALWAEARRAPFGVCVSDIRDRFRYLAFEKATLEQQATPVSTEALEADRLAALDHETVRSGYRMTAKVFLHTDRWWEPGYVPPRAESLDLLCDLDGDDA